MSEGNIDAPTAFAASSDLWDRGLTAFSITSKSPAGTSWWHRDLFRSGSSTRPDDLAAFTRELATLNAADIPLDDTLRVLAEQATSRQMKELSAELLQDVLSGNHLSEAMQKRPQVFSSEYISAVRAGETGGTLGQVLTNLASLLERRSEVRAKIRSALTYPILLMGLSLISVGIVVGGLIPSIAPIFAENGRSMPWAIGVVLGAQAYWQEILFALAIGLLSLAGVAAAISRSPERRLRRDRAMLRLPVYGPFLLRLETARFSRTLGTLLQAGVPLLQATISAREVLQNGQIGAGIDQVIDALREGRALHRALDDHTNIPSVALRIIAIGEESGKLERMLMRLAEMFEQQTQHTIDRFMSLLTPSITIGIAVIIGGLIVTVINAILSINDIALR